MKNKLYFLNLIFIIVFITGCELEDDYTKNETNEKKEVQKFLEINNLNTEPTSSGLFIISNNSDSFDGENAEYGDYVVFDYNLMLLDSSLVETSDSLKAKKEDIYNTAILYGPVKMRVGSWLQGGNEAFTNMKEGATTKLLIPFDLGYGGTAIDYIPSYSTLLADINLIEIIKDPVSHEKMQLDTFLTNHPVYDTIQNGLYYQKLIDGTGEEPSNTSTLTFYYELSLIDGRLVDKKETTVYYEGTAVLGMNIALSMMKKGEKANLLIHSDLAYGESGHFNIPPYSTLKVYVELREIE